MDNERAFPVIRQTVLDTTDPRRLAEFYRQLFGLRYSPGDEPPGPGQPDPRGQDWLILTSPAGGAALAFQKVGELPGATWPDGPMTAFFDPGNPAGRPSWRKAGLNRGVLRSGGACWCAGWGTRPRAGWRRSDPRSRASGARRAGRWTGTRVRVKPSSGALPAVSPATRT
ncbi:MAG: VOC family protein [Streptosporangiaceae bacterium]